MIPSMNRNGSLTVLLSAILALSTTSLTAADELPRQQRHFLQTYCSQCHGGDSAKGDFELDFLKSVESKSDAEYWQLVLDNFHLGEMPPEGESQPKPTELEEMTSWIEAELNRAAARLRGDAGKSCFDG